MTDLDVACQLGSGLLGLGDGPAGNHRPAPQRWLYRCRCCPR
jgi:hypothetical protein